MDESLSTNRHALIIEDEALLALELESCLQEAGFTSFDHAATEEQAVRAALRRCPGLITADMQLRRGTGVGAVTEIARICRAVPTVFVTGSPKHVAAAIPNALIVTKPCDPLHLETAISEARTRCAAETR